MQYFVLFLAQSFGNVLLVLLLVLYLLAESGTVSPGSLRAKVDSQIQRYVVIKTAISGLQGALVYLFLGPFLNVRMSHLFGVFHFLLNFIPTAGPILATCACGRRGQAAGCRGVPSRSQCSRSDALSRPHAATPMLPTIYPRSPPPSHCRPGPGALRHGQDHGLCGAIAGALGALCAHARHRGRVAQG